MTQEIIIQDIDQPKTELKKERRRPKFPFWAWGLMALFLLLIGGGVLAGFLVKKEADQNGVLDLTPTPTEIPEELLFPSGTFGEKWLEIRNELENFDFQQKELQPPELDLKVSL